MALAEKEGLKGLIDESARPFRSRASALQLEAISAEVGGFGCRHQQRGDLPSKPFEDYTIEEHQAGKASHADAGIICGRSPCRMRASAGGRIINVASVTAYGGWANLSPYVQSKGALIGLTRTWAREFGAYGITVNAVSPGAFRTDAEKIHRILEGYTLCARASGTQAARPSWKILPMR